MSIQPVERVQVKVTGVTDERYVVACNGRRVPLRPTGRRGEFVGAVRFKAWQPPSGLHPMMGVHTPLVFDILDPGTNVLSVVALTIPVIRAVGVEETFPVNANEAESRRIARFREIGHTAGKFEVPVEETSRDYPYTLDLRKLSPC